MIKIENLGEFMMGLDEWIEECEMLADGAFRGLALAAFDYIVHGTPEWGGNLAASWRLTIGGPVTNYAPSVYKRLGFERLIAPGTSTPSPYSRQSPNTAAIALALGMAKESAAMIHTGVDVYISNAAPYAQEVEANIHERTGVPFIRAVNLPIEMVQAAHDFYSSMGEISTEKALLYGKLGGIA